MKVFHKGNEVMFKSPNHRKGPGKVHSIEPTGIFVLWFSSPGDWDCSFIHKNHFKFLRRVK